jgi:TrmH RNA methyltransferase
MESPAPPPRPDRSAELRIFGVNACLAVAAKRPHAIRKAYLTAARVLAFKPVLAELARRKVGYNIVESADLERLTQSTHHEGVCFEVRRTPPVTLKDFVAAQKDPRAPALAILLPSGGGLALSGAACRVAEGGAEAVPLVALADTMRDLDALERAGFTLAATVVRDGESLYGDRLPRRLILMFGAEGGGVSRGLLARAKFKVEIPGSGAVESLNIAAAVAVVAGEYWRQHKMPRAS